MDTRVTNAITGGDLAAPVSYNILLTPYANDVYPSTEYAYISSSAQNSMRASLHYYTPNAYARRVYSTAFKVPKNAKLYFNASLTDHAQNAGNIPYPVAAYSVNNGAWVDVDNNSVISLAAYQNANIKFSWRIQNRDRNNQDATVTVSRFLLTNES